MLASQAFGEVQLTAIAFFDHSIIRTAGYVRHSLQDFLEGRAQNIEWDQEDIKARTYDAIKEAVDLAHPTPVLTIGTLHLRQPRSCS